MSTILTFENFSNKNFFPNELFKVCIIREDERGDSMITGKNYNVKDCWHILTQDDNWYEVPANLPILNYNKETLDSLSSMGLVSDNQIYNKPGAREKVSSKSRFCDIHRDSGYIPKTVLDPSEVPSIDFPVVAKPDNNHSGLGIEVFDNIEDFSKADHSRFTTYSEKIPIKKEYRVWLWRGEILQCAERIPMGKSGFDISKKAPDQKTNFCYLLINKEGLGKEIINACSYFSEMHSDLDFYAIDFAESRNGKIYVFEMNTEPGPLFGVMTMVYQKIYEDYYRSKLSEETMEKLAQFRYHDALENAKRKEFRIEKGFKF